MEPSLLLQSEKIKGESAVFGYATQEYQKLVQQGDIRSAFMVLDYHMNQYRSTIPIELILACGSLAQQLHDVSKALNAYSFALEKEPTNYKALWMRAAVLGTSGPQAEYLAALDDILSKYPRDTAAMFNRAMLFLRDQKINEAIQELRTVLSVDPNHAASSGNVGLLYMQTGKYELAERFLKASVQVQPNKGYEDALKAVGEVLSMLSKLESGALAAEINRLNAAKKFSEATKLLDTYFAIPSMNADDRLWHLKGIVLASSGDFGAAGQALTRSITLNKNSQALATLKQLDGDNEKQQLARIEDARLEREKLKRAKDVELAQLKKNLGVDLLEQSWKTIREKREQTRQKLQAAQRSLDASKRLKTQTNGQMHATMIGTKQTASRIARLLNVDLQTLRSVEVASYGEAERTILTIDELCSSDSLVQLPQPRPMVISHQLVTSGPAK